MKYLHLSKDGYVTGFGECQPENFKGISLINEGRTIEHVGAFPDPMRKIRVVSGKFVDEGPLLQYTWADERRMAYPPMHEQLEALTEGGQKLAELQQRILAVKLKFPKP